jgi:hypothetical protein
MFSQAEFPGSRMIPAGCAIRSLLALKLFGSARHSHVMSYVLDEGLALFSGLNVIPKRSFLTEYSCRVNPQSYTTLMRLWFDAMGTQGLERGSSFDLDFHTIPFTAKTHSLTLCLKGRRQKDPRLCRSRCIHQVFCYGNADLRKEDQMTKSSTSAVLKQRTGHCPGAHLIQS